MSNYINKEDFEKIPIEYNKKYTIIWVSSMAFTTKEECTIKDKITEDYAQYKDTIVLSILPKNKRKTVGLRITKDMLFLKNQDLNTKLDTELRSFSGNALINLVGEPEKLKETLEKESVNLTEEIKGIITYCNEEKPTEKKLLYPKEAEKTRYNHAVVNEMLKKLEKVKE